MKFNHLSFPSTDVAATVAFFVDQLGCSAESFGSSAVLKRAGFGIVIDDATDRLDEVLWPDNFHLVLNRPRATSCGRCMSASSGRAYG